LDRALDLGVPLSTRAAAPAPRAAPEPSPEVTHAQLLAAMLPFAKSSTPKGVALVVSDYLLLALGLGLALMAPSWPLRVLGGTLAGFKIGALYTLAHDAAHNTLTRSRRLNKVLAVLGHMPGLFNTRLWLHDHNATHHPLTNGPQHDAHTPMSWEQYRQAPGWRRAWERFGRSLTLWSAGPHYALGRWAEGKVVPTSEYPAAVRREAWPYTGLNFVYLGALIAGVAVHNGGAVAATLGDLLFVIGVPFFVYQTGISIVLYFQHTHPAVPWFAESDPERAKYRQDELTIWVKVPRIIATFMHNPFEHPAHHVCPTIPCYNLRDAQHRLSELLGDRSLEVPFSIGRLRTITRQCKLYDYDRHCWLSFDGQVTAQASKVLARDPAGSAVTVNGPGCTPRSSNLCSSERPGG
jgi:acyl-lipid omega-6 desaturase (Delta-12 desaturase)